MNWVQSLMIIKSTKSKRDRFFTIKKSSSAIARTRTIIKILTVLINDDGGDEREQLETYHAVDLP